MSQNKKVDILGDLLAGQNTEHSEDDNLLNELIRPKTEPGIPIGDKTSPKPTRKSKKKRRNKKKATHYISQDSFIKLEKAKKDLKSMLPDKFKSSVTKSGIVDEAVQAILDEFAKNKDNSYLVKKLLHEGKEKP